MKPDDTPKPRNTSQSNSGSTGSHKTMPTSGDNSVSPATINAVLPANPSTVPATNFPDKNQTKTKEPIHIKINWVQLAAIGFFMPLVVIYGVFAIGAVVAIAWPLILILLWFGGIYPLIISLCLATIYFTARMLESKLVPEPTLVASCTVVFAVCGTMLVDHYLFASGGNSPLIHGPALAPLLALTPSLLCMISLLLFAFILTSRQLLRLAWTLRCTIVIVLAGIPLVATIIAKHAIPAF